MVEPVSVILISANILLNALNLIITPVSLFINRISHSECMNGCCKIDRKVKNKSFKKLLKNNKKNIDIKNIEIENINEL